MKRKSVANSKEVVGTLDVKTRKARDPVTLDPHATPKPQGPSDYREFLDYKAHAYWALCESQVREARARSLQERRLAKKGLSLSDVAPPDIVSLPAETDVVGPVGRSRGD